MEYEKITIPAIRFENGDVLVAIDKTYDEYHIDDGEEVYVLSKHEMEESYDVVPDTFE